MKKIIAFFTIITMIVLSGCGAVDNDAFSLNKDHYAAVADFARSYYADNTIAAIDHITLEFHEGKIAEINGFSKLDIDNAPDEVLESVRNIEGIGFEYLWVSASYVIFWKDDLKNYGLLWSASPMQTIKQLKVWYSEMKYNRLEREWYEIGTRGV